MRLLAAEDNEINAEILAELLELEGASCEIVENGRLAALFPARKQVLVLPVYAAAGRRQQHGPRRAGGPDAILMDVQMPVMNGHEATRAIRAMEREDAKQIPIIGPSAQAPILAHFHRRFRPFPLQIA